MASFEALFWRKRLRCMGSPGVPLGRLGMSRLGQMEWNNKPASGLAGKWTFRKGICNRGRERIKNSSIMLVRNVKKLPFYFVHFFPLFMFLILCFLPLIILLFFSSFVSFHYPHFYTFLLLFLYFFLSLIFGFNFTLWGFEFRNDPPTPMTPNLPDQTWFDFFQKHYLLLIDTLL